MMGLREGLKMIRGMRRQQNEDQQRVAAKAIVNHQVAPNEDSDGNLPRRVFLRGRSSEGLG